MSLKILNEGFSRYIKSLKEGKQEEKIEPKYVEALKDKVRFCYSRKDLEEIGADLSQLSQGDIHRILDDNINDEDIEKMFGGYSFVDDDFGIEESCKKRVKESRDKTSETDRIDAKHDNKVERAKKALSKADDDADSLKDMRKKRAKAKFEKELDRADADRDDEKKAIKEVYTNSYRYQVVTFSYDSGEDEKQDRHTFSEARSAAKQYIDDDYYDSVCVYDRKNKKFISLKGDHFEQYNESLKESTSSDLSEYQKWVDYDMKKYKRISDETMNKIKKAGFSVVKDQYGDYEVIADRPIKESKKSLKEAPVYDLSPRFDSRKSFYNKAKVDTGKGDENKLYLYNTLVAEIKEGKPVVYDTYSQTTLRHIKDWLKQNGFKADSSKQIMSDYGVKNESFKRKKGKKLRESANYRGNPEIEFVWHGEWSDPELIYKGQSFNYWDIEDALWYDFLEETGHKDNEFNDPKVEAEFDKYVQDNASYYLDDVMASMNESCKRKKSRKKLHESASEDEIRRAVDEHFDYGVEADFQDLIEDLVSRVDDYSDDEDIMDSIDAGMTYSKDQWTAIEHYMSPSEVFGNVFESLYSDVYSICSKLAEKDKNSEE